jgi:hypothetical protein
MSADELLPNEIEYFRNKFGIFDYQFWTLNGLLQEVDVRGRTVLEVGGSNLPRELVLGRLGAEAWHCIDLLPGEHFTKTHKTAHYSLERIKPLSDFHPAHLVERYNIFDGRIQDAGALPAEHYEVVISIASFEHIQDFGDALRSIRRMMKPGAKLFSNFGPIWSCRVGHHIWVDDDLNFTVEDATPPFAHLLYSRDAVHAALATRFGDRRATNAVTQMFDEGFINRLFYEDYEALTGTAGFSEASTTSSWDDEVDPALQARLEALYPGRRRFGAYNAKIFCRA